MIYNLIYGATTLRRITQNLLPTSKKTLCLFDTEKKAIVI